MALPNNILTRSLAEVSEMLYLRRITSVELTEFYLERSRRLGPALNAYATLTPELALEQARQADTELRAGKPRGPLHGIPYAAKDLLATKGIRTTWGAKPFENQVFDYDATVIRKLREAGAVLLGKAAMIELAGGMGYRFGSASVQGPAKNPWDTGCWTCGSSSGSGAIMAAQLAPFTIGTETWGSIICPSAFCGVSGLRPTYGRVSRHGAMALSYSMDKIGPMCRTASDCATVLRVIAGDDQQDATTLGLPRLGIVAPAQRLRIGVLTNQWSKPDPEVAKLASAAIQTLANSGHVVSDAKLPEGPWEPAAGVIISVEGVSAFEKLIESGGVQQLADPVSRIGAYSSLTIGAADYVRALRVREVLRTRMQPLWENFDVLACASLPVTASKLETPLDEGLAFSDPIGGIGNMLGIPALTVPCGFTSAGLPAGVQFIGPAFAEHKVLAAGAIYQSRTDWHRRLPKLG